MKDLGYLRYFLGIEVAYSPEGYILSQSQYISEVINRAGLTDDRIMDSPIEVNHRLSPTDGELLSDVTRYREVVGSLVYVTVTCPNITYVVHVVSQFASASRITHWAVVLRILCYLRGTVHHGLLLSSTSDLVLTGYSDAGWAELGFPQLSATPMFCDNQSAIQIVKNLVFHERTKHIEIDCHFVWHHYLHGSLTLPHVSSTSQLADVFTKSHTTPRFHHLISKLMFVKEPKSLQEMVNADGKQMKGLTNNMFCHNLSWRVSEYTVLSDIDFSRDTPATIRCKYKFVKV
ncbi:uncharacterized mitochondrial protein AtMg00810-like [Aristolochia californica]|uniref:uncharacterized mitochondrial protein AtMg00810-like n=1 Tax=Aristolochia californica TaxID=171875 RepID=UPI0035D8A48C